MNRRALAILGSIAVLASASAWAQAPEPAPTAAPTAAPAAEIPPPPPEARPLPGPVPAVSAATPGTNPGQSPMPTPAAATPPNAGATATPFAVTPPPLQSASPAPLPGSTAGSTLQMAFYIFLLLALFGAGAWVLRFGVPGMTGGGRGPRRLNILETRSLGARQFLVVAEYEGRKMLLGVCPGRIDHLAELSAPASAAPKFPEIGPEPEAPRA